MTALILQILQILETGTFQDSTKAQFSQMALC